MTLSRWIKGVWSGWERFWFEAESELPVRVFRRVFAGLLLCFYALRTPDLMLFYSKNGILPLSVMETVMDMRWRFSLLRLFSGDLAVWGLHFLFLGALMALILDWRPRASAIVAFVLHVSFLHRNYMIAYGMDLISTFLLFNLCLTSKSGKTILDSVALRLCQFQVCVIYGYSGLEKLRGTSWWSGEALWFALANPQLARFDFTWLADYPGLIAFATWSSLLWEVYFPVLIWVPRLRYPVLVFGVLLHLGIALTINIPFFGLLMIVSYLTFVRPSELERLCLMFRQSVFKKSQVQPSGADQFSV